MTEIFPVIYVQETATPLQFSGVCARINEWLWTHTVLGRLRLVDVDSLTNEMIDEAHLVFIEWRSKPDMTKTLYKRIHGRNHEVPICIIRCFESPTRGAASKTFENELRGAKIIRASELEEQVTPIPLAELERLLPFPDIDLADAYKHPEIVRLKNSIGYQRFPFYIQTYFPDATNLKIEPVRGGWSDAPLCKVEMNDDQNQSKEYYLKFFDTEIAFKKELEQHERTVRWLDLAAKKGMRASVGLRQIPQFTGPIEQAFPSRGGKAVYAVCYESASTDIKRVTLRQVYAKGSYDAVNAALSLLLVVLGSQESPQLQKQSPRSKNDDRNTPHYISMKMLLSLLDSIHDLEDYGKAICPDWSDRILRLRNLIYNPNLPAWLLDDSVQVMSGSIHGDPNPRNCLVNESSGMDLLLIDYGDYRPSGPLVSDLALVERDLKLVLMGTDAAAAPFYDLDTRWLKEWCEAEQIACKEGLSFKQELAAKIKVSESVSNAYGFVGKVREQAEKLSGDYDKKGRHYFGALLYWTLRMLQDKPVRRVKKLLALYSASEILDRFA
jgi:hypothetical protein